MSVKETIHEWIDSIPDNSPGLAELYEQARLDLAIEQARKSVREGRTTPIDEVIARFEEKCRLRHSA
jgi:hypothetical protein